MNDRLIDGLNAPGRGGRGEVGAVLILPPEFSAAYANGDHPAVEVVTTRDRPAAAAAARGLASVMVRRLTAVRAFSGDRVVDESGTAGFGQVSPATAPLVLASVTIGDRGAGPVDYYGPAVALMALPFTVAFAGRSLWVERRTGTLPRVLAAPVRMWQVLAGKALAALAMGTVGISVLWGTTALVFGASWGPPEVVAAFILVSTLAAIGVTVLIAGLARTEDSIDQVTMAVGFGFGLLGGLIVPVDQLSGGWRVISRFTPNGAALESMSTARIDDGASISVLWTAVGLSLAAVVSAAVGLALLRRAGTA